MKVVTENRCQFKAWIWQKTQNSCSVIFQKVRVINLTQGGLRAMSDLEELERERGNEEYMEGTKIGVSAVDLQKSEVRTASNEMCTFLVMNISSLQLIPVNIIAYRSQYWSVNPAAVIAPAIVATFLVRWWRWYIVKQWAENIIDELVNWCYTIPMKLLKIRIVILGDYILRT